MIDRFKPVWLVAFMSVTACASSDARDPERQAMRRPDSESPSEPGARPKTWDDASHGEDVDPDYARVFSTLEVHRIDIEMSPDTRQAMIDDMTRLLGEPGSGMGMGGFAIPPELTKACEGKKANDACSFQTAAGSCRELPGALLCIPADAGFPGGPGGMGPGGMGPGGMPPGGGFPGGSMGPIDLVPGDPAYVPVTVRFDGREWTKVGMRYKGNSSLASAWRSGRMKIGFRLQFDEFEDDHPEIENQRFFGFRELTFSSGWNDAALLRDALAAELLRSEGLPAAHWAFYRVYVDVGEGPVYWGLYTMIEDPSDALPGKQFASDGGNMYKPDGEGADFTRFAEAGFEKKSNEEEADYSDVMRAIDALHASREDPASWRAALERAFDVPTFLRTLAVSRAIGHWDSYGRMAHNYYLYGDPANDGRLTWISWDHNLSWQGGGGMGGGGFGFGDLTPMMDEVTARWPLIRSLLDDETYRAQYRTELTNVLDGDYAKDRFDARATELHELIAPYVLGDGDGDAETAPFTHLASPDAFRTALTDPARGLLSIAEQRRQAVRDALVAE